MAERARQESPDQIERDIEMRRADMTETLDALQGHVAPGRWADAAGTIARREGAALSQAALARVRAQPVAAALVAAGLAWLLMSDAPRGGRRPHPRRPMRPRTAPRGRPAAAPPL